MSELLKTLENLAQRLAAARDFLDVDRRQSELKALETAMSAPGFWDNRRRAENTARQADALRDDIETLESLTSETQYLLELAQLDAADKSENLREEIEPKVVVLVEKLRNFEVRTLLNGPYDEHDAIVAIHAGAGGTEAQDWAAMLLRMLFRYAERRKWSTRILDESRGEEVGVKSVVFEVHGRHAYGLFKGEAGVHRLVRLSPFNADHQRHTSFALVEVIPDLGDAPDVDVRPEDIRIDTFLSSGHGGQSVQTTYSAVRIVHLPTGLTVSCQNERSQQQNKETALRILKSRLKLIELEKLTAEKQKLRGEFREAAWGNQIRSYVLHPYHLVKDLRTKHESSDPDRVLDGEIEDFVEAYLRWKAAGGKYERLEGRDAEKDDE
ncbi:MAG: peptide chain release factor 2 [Candidatus Uhrbacteria bacterium]